MKILLFSDPHIKENAIEELDKIFSEIISYSADMCICLGDYLEKRPTPKEIYFATKWAVEFKQKYKQFILITGNHPTLETDFSSESYLKFLDILIPNVQYVYNDLNKNYYFGHVMTEQSNMAYGLVVPDISKFEVYIRDLDSYILSILGHQHSFQQITSQIYHIGACRFVDFGEKTDEDKYIAILDTNMVELQFIPLSSVIPMKEVRTFEELEKLDENYKICFTFTDFLTFKNSINIIQKYKSKFIQFKIKLDFPEPELKIQQNKTNSLRDMIYSWLNSIQDENVKSELKTELMVEQLL